MQRSTPWPAGTPCWVDLSVSDLARSQNFYGQVLGWTYTEPVEEYGNYCNALVDGRAVAGLAPAPSDGSQAPSTWTVYLATEDLDDTHSRALAGGASEVAAPMDLAPLGRMALWADPAGALFGAWESGTHTGFQVVDDPGSPAWIDLSSRDYERARAFYAELFGYSYDDTPPDEASGMRYTMFTPPGADRPAGGIGSHRPDVSWAPGWSVAFAVADVDAALSVVTRAGGSVLEQASDFEYGRMATVTGPDGEQVTLFSGPPM